eukprot:jgi/Tetstr1/454066/TSEL_040985.t1
MECFEGQWNSMRAGFREPCASVQDAIQHIRDTPGPADANAVSVEWLLSACQWTIEMATREMYRDCKGVPTPEFAAMAQVYISSIRDRNYVVTEAFAQKLYKLWPALSPSVRSWLALGVVRPRDVLLVSQP